MKLENTLVKDYILAGKAIVTIESAKTMKRYTYSFRKLENKEIWFVSVLTGGENYVYMATLFNRDLRITGKSKFTRESPAYVALNWMIKHIDHLPGNLNVYHEGKCGRCGRTLTDPESIRTGLGPICRGA